MCTDGDLPVASWKLSLFTLYIWIQRWDLLCTAEQEGSVNLIGELCTGAVWGWKCTKGRSYIWHVLHILYIYTGMRGKLAVFQSLILARLCHSHGSEALVFLMWSCSCQQYILTQDFIESYTHPGILPLPQAITSYIYTRLDTPI